MSSYKKNSSRIPKGSVAISDNSYVLKAEDILTDEYLTDEEKHKKRKTNELELREQQLNEYERNLVAMQQQIEMERRNLENERTRLSIILQEEQQKFEHEKRMDYYKMREFMWNQAVLLAEDILNQKLEMKDISISKTFEGMIKKIPVAFDELTVVLNPETLELIKAENPKENWIFKNVNWKFDYSLQLGEFLIEEQNEFYDFTFKTMFDEIKRKIEQKNIEIRGEDGND